MFFINRFGTIGTVFLWGTSKNQFSDESVRRTSG